MRPSLTELEASLLGSSHGVYPEDPLVWGDQLLPNWAYSYEAAASSKSGNENYVVGPAVPLAAEVLITLSVIYVVSPASAYFVTDCPDGDEMAQYPLWLVPLWFVLMPIFLVKLEVRVLKYAIVPHVRRCNAFKVLGEPLRFSVWFAAALALSVIGQACFVTNGLFFAVAMKTDFCNAPAAVRWKRHIEQSVWGSVPLLGSASPTLLATIVYFTMVPQLLYTLAISYPTSPEYSTNEPVNYKVQSTTCQKYDTLAATQTHHGPALQALGEFCRMVTVTFQHWAYRESKGIHTKLVLKEIKRLVLKFLVFSCLATAPQLIIQSTAPSFGKSYQSSASVFVNLVMAMKVLGTEVLLIWRLARHAEEDMSSPNFSSEDLEGLFPTIDAARCFLRTWVAVFALLALLFGATVVLVGIWGFFAVGPLTLAATAAFLAAFAWAGYSLVRGYAGKRAQSERKIKVRMVNWKVGLKRPSKAEAVQVIAGDASAPVVFVYEMEMPADTTESAACLAIEGGAPYQVLHEFREPHAKYLVTVSVLVRKGPDAERFSTIGEHHVICRSPGKRTHKVGLAQAVRLGPEGSAVLYLAGVNMDPHDKEFHEQLNQMGAWLEGLNDAAGVLLVGDFNCRLPCPSWANLEVAQSNKGERSILSQSTVEDMCSKLASAHGRRKVAQLDQLAPGATGGSKQAERLRGMLHFDSLGSHGDPGFPTYKRTPGEVPVSDPDCLERVFFCMPAEEGDAVSPQRYLTGQLGGGVQELQLGWLDRAAWRLSPGSQVTVRVLSHEGMPAPALSDHAATVTQFSVMDATS